MKANILLVGQGNMAKAIHAAFSPKSYGYLLWVRQEFGQHCPLDMRLKDNTVAIHVGSGRLLPTLIDVCEEMNMPLIQGSTKLTNPVPAGRNVTIINAPNFSLPMVRLLTTLPLFAEGIRPGMDVRIVESHQHKKPDTSGTARAIAGAVNVPEAEITKVRDVGAQLALGVPPEHLGGHAYHNFIFTGQGVEIKVSTRIHGRETYAEGAITLAEALLNQKEPMKTGIYQLKDILHLLPT